MTDHHQPDLWGAIAEEFAPVPLIEHLCPTCHGAGSITSARMAEMMERPGQVARGASETSRKAGTTPRKGTQRYHVLMALAKHRDGLTAYRVSALIGKSPNQTATRLGELHDDTFVEYLRHPVSRSIVEEPTTEGNTGMVHVLTAAGDLALLAAQRA